MAFRSVPRPSSPPGAKASTECPSFTHSKWRSLIQTSHLRCSVIRMRHSPRAKIRRRSRRVTHHAQEPSIRTTYASPGLGQHHPLGTGGNQTKHRQKSQSTFQAGSQSYGTRHGSSQTMPNPAIMLLNTRTQRQYGQRSSRRTGSDNPLPPEPDQSTANHKAQSPRSTPTGARIQTHQNLFTLTKEQFWSSRSQTKHPNRAPPTFAGMATLGMEFGIPPYDKNSQVRPRTQGAALHPLGPGGPRPQSSQRPERR